MPKTHARSSCLELKWGLRTSIMQTISRMEMEKVLAKGEPAMEPWVEAYEDLEGSEASRGIVCTW